MASFAIGGETQHLSKRSSDNALLRPGGGNNGHAQLSQHNSLPPTPTPPESVTSLAGAGKRHYKKDTR